MKSGELKNGKPIARRHLLKTGLLAAVGLGGLSGVDALFVEPHWLDVVRHDVFLNDLHPSFDGFVVVQISDVHHGRFVGLDFIQKVVDAANSIEPDIVVLTGDYAFGASSYIEPAIQALSGLQARHGIAAVLGNWDHGLDAAATRRHLQDAGIVELNNSHITVSEGGGEICIAGLDELRQENQDLDAAFAGVDENTPRILLQHNPDYAEEMPANQRVDLMLSGHTHGGQVVLPLLPALTPSKYGSKYQAGWVEGPCCPIYVTRGIGTIILPVRFNCRPELTVFTLRV